MKIDDRLLKAVGDIADLLNVVAKRTAALEASVAPRSLPSIDPLLTLGPVVVPPASAHSGSRCGPVTLTTTRI